MKFSIRGFRRRRRVEKYKKLAKKLAKKYILKFTKLKFARTKLRKVIDFFDPDDRDLGDLVDEILDKD